MTEQAIHGDTSDREAVKILLQMMLGEEDSKKVDFIFTPASDAAKVYKTAGGSKLLAIPVNLLHKPEIIAYIGHELSHQDNETDSFETAAAKFKAKFLHFFSIFMNIYKFLFKGQTQIELRADLGALSMMRKMQASADLLESFLNFEIQRAEKAFTGINRLLVIDSLRSRLDKVRDFRRKHHI